jgi:GMP synthase-like glutamine amidotransferase
VPRIGLLECDHVADRFRSIGGDYGDMFAALLPSVDLVHFDAIGGELPASPDECDGWVATGSRHSVYEDLDWIVALRSFVADVKRAEVPFVGICFGHQLLAHSTGGRTEHAGRWGVGAHDMKAGTDHARLLYMHQDQVTSLPPDAVVLGSTDHCPNAMIRVGDRMLGMQAHPEFSAEYVEALLHSREERIGHDEVAAALASLDAPRDERLAVTWMMQYLA